MTNHQKYMFRCLQLAANGKGKVAPNPLVGAVLVANDQIIGEGWHRFFGGPHAEPECIGAVLEKHQHLIAEATLYVSLEPCAHFGKTPPCVDLIIKHQIPRVVIGCQDPFKKVNGQGIEQLKAAGVEVVLDVLEEECKKLNQHFFTYHTRQRPWVLIKWAQSADGFIAGANGVRTKISNSFTDVQVHRWRSEHAAILVGRNTALMDNPALTTRYWPGPQPVRAVYDPHLSLPPTLHLLDNSIPSIVINAVKESAEQLVQYKKLNPLLTPVAGIVELLYGMELNSVLVEGGAALINQWLPTGLWDELRVITNTKLSLGKGLAAPKIPSAQLIKEERLGTDLIQYFSPINQDI